MLIRADIITTVATTAKIKKKYLIQGNLELYSRHLCFYRYHHLVRASMGLKGRAQKKI